MISERKTSSSKLRVVVLGHIVRLQLGGVAWHHLNYCLGLTQLGHDVFYLEDSGDSPWACYQPRTYMTDSDPSNGLRFAAHAFGKLGLGNKWAYHDAFQSKWLGPCADRSHEICSTADLLIRTSHVNPMRPWLQKIPVRVLIDVDPVFTQMRHLDDAKIREDAMLYNRFVTFAENVTYNPNLLPDDGFRWQPTRTPVVLDAWPVTPAPTKGKFSTVLQWDSYQTRNYKGQHYGMKSRSFFPYLDLPQRSGAVFELAIGGSSAPRQELANKGWVCRDPIEVTRDPWTYQRYIQESKAEFTVAKHGYVLSWGGWFSERSVNYLASGRPVLTQDTGFSEWLPTGSGVLAFRSPEEALDGIEEINSRYEFHCKAARAIAEEYFDARKVLPHLIERSMNAAPSPSKEKPF
jgi:hypothetical protein